MDSDILFFFDGKPEELALYEALLAALANPGEVKAEAHRTQISLRNRKVFACVSFLRPLRKAQLPEHYVTLTLGLPYPLVSPRIAAVTEAQKRRWTHHIVLSSPSELDDELLGWLREAWEFGGR